MDRRQFLLAGSSLLAATPFAGVRAQAPIAARIGYIPIIGTAPIFVANGEGWLKQAGIEPAFTVFESGPNMIQALASGTIDLYVAGVAPLAVARSRGVDIRVVASTATGENVFVAAPALAKFFTAGTAAAAAFKAHKAATGKVARLATQPAGSVPNTVLQYWLWEVAKADKADVEIVPMGIDATQQAVLAGAVEGAIVREPALTIVQTRNPGIKLIAGGEELFPGQPGTVVAASGNFVTKNPDAVQKLVNGLVRAADLLAKSPDKAAPHVGAALGKGIVDPALIQKALVSPASKFEIDPRKIIAPARAMQAYQVKLGSLEKELPFDGLFETQFYERALKAAG
ncbi:MAG: ABC transporter substrate-binding protein [Bosea sp.]|uniref:ABC transporter substrate-binding protein n=1 Tax=Bosea sp. (in: a-proteobacteria) TaxID=1871050 RepID=UPI00086F81D4|nr:ABC transporter substrate-binding protein [Bosea sp. (in: a-proteobacteria)]MBN9469316.1 ABC transporter substrate-binding protein [Bosea sp. (in: a-proteobacteria)]ODT55272.1 MAG: nitrate ABC transporter substrate-binding protein [Methylobacterium sp. SCN 67-24]